MNGITAAAQGKVVGTPPTLQYTSEGTSYLAFSVLIDEGENKEPQFLRVTAWGERAQDLDGKIVKGVEVYVEGRLRASEWKDAATGEVRHGLNVSAWIVQPLGQIGRRSGGWKQGSGSPGRAARPSEERGLRQRLGA